jgi:hypothetical protein
MLGAVSVTWKENEMLPPESRAAALLLHINSELERRHMNLRGSGRPLLDASADLAANHAMFVRLANEEAVGIEEVLDHAESGISLLTDWVTAIGGRAPDRLGPTMREWCRDAEALRAEAAANRPAGP